MYILLQESETVTQHFDSESGKAALKFVQVTPDDVGNYTCVFTNTLGTAETKAVLHVNSKLETDFFHILLEKYFSVSVDEILFIHVC